MKWDEFIDEKILSVLRKQAGLRYGILAAVGISLYLMAGILQKISKNAVISLIQMLLALFAVLGYMAATNAVPRFDPNGTLRRSYTRAFCLSVICFGVLVAETAALLIL